MEKETRQRKPYQGVQCKLIDYTEETLMFAVSWTDKGGISRSVYDIYESLRRAAAYAVEQGPYQSWDGNYYMHVKDPACSGEDCPVAYFHVWWKGTNLEERMASAQWVATTMTPYDVHEYFCRGNRDAGILSHVSLPPITAGSGYGYSYGGYCC